MRWRNTMKTSTKKLERQLVGTRPRTTHYMRTYTVPSSLHITELLRMDGHNIRNMNSWIGYNKYLKNCIKQVLFSKIDTWCMEPWKLNSTIFVSPSRELKIFVLLLYGKLWYQQTSALIMWDNWMFILLLLQCCKGNSNTHCGTQWHCCYCCCHQLPLIYQIKTFIGQQVSNVSLLTDQFHFVCPLLRHVFSSVTEAKQDRCKFSICCRM